MSTVALGERVEIEVELGKLSWLEVGLGFAVREGGRTVAGGVITNVFC